MKNKKSHSTFERLEQLQRFIEGSNHVTVTEVCEMFDVSEATARRDLELLAGKGKIQRVHGGAVSLKSSPPENPVYQRLSDQPEEKQRIGVAAAALLSAGDTVFLGSGTTTLEVARQISREIELTVITNSLLIINQLQDYAQISLVSLGGILRPSELSMIGHITENNLESLHTDKVIIGINGIDINRGLTNHFLPETVIDRKILNLGEEVIVVADHTKCERISTVQVGPISSMNTLVTDIEAPVEFVENLRQLGIRVEQV